MKRFASLTVVLFCLTASVSAFTPPNGQPYGHDSNGNYWLASSHVNAAEGQVPKLKCKIDGWKAHIMKLDGAYYVVTVKASPAGSSMDYCFDIGGNRYIPDALQQADDQSLWAKIPDAEKPDNGQGGYNFRTKTIAAQ